MESLLYWIDRVNDWVWGPVLIILMISSGLYLSFRLRWVQLRHLWYAHKLAITKHDDNAEGDISHFQALMTALAGTIGIGSITGVATAIATGGLGSIFWMWVAALFGMATKFGEAILAIKYRVVDKQGEMCGGPMYYLDRGLKSKFLAVLFAVMAAIAALGTGNMIQANSVAAAFSEISSIQPIWVGIVLMIFTAIPLLGGIKSIGKVVTVVVPAMAIFYIVGAGAVVCMNYQKVPEAFLMIFKTAFTGQAAAGGFLGSTVMLAIQFGFSRGVFSSEAGLGTSPIAAAAAKTDSPGRQALVSMSSVFITTGIVCTLTGLVIATTGVQGILGSNGEMLDGSALALKAFSSAIPFGAVFVSVALCFFAYSTMLGWAYYGEKAVEYLFGVRSTIPYRILYILAVIPGAVLNLKVVWGIANIFNGLMAFPNLIGILLLGGVIAKETEIFEKLLKREREKKFLFQ
jgi:AGCS family alanine or glycine:cation symporter